MRFKNILAPLTLMIPTAIAGFLTFGICQSGCVGVALTCYRAAGFTSSIVPSSTYDVVTGCNSALAMCSARCAAFCFHPRTLWLVWDSREDPTSCVAGKAKRQFWGCFQGPSLSINLSLIQKFRDVPTILLLTELFANISVWHDLIC